MHECFAPNSPRSFRPSVPLSNTRHHTRRTAPRTRPEPARNPDTAGPRLPLHGARTFASPPATPLAAVPGRRTGDRSLDGQATRIAWLPCMHVIAAKCSMLQYASFWILPGSTTYTTLLGHRLILQAPWTMALHWNTSSNAINQSSRLDTGSGRQLGPS